MEHMKETDLVCLQDLSPTKKKQNVVIPFTPSISTNKSDKNLQKADDFTIKETMMKQKKMRRKNRMKNKTKRRD